MSRYSQPPRDHKSGYHKPSQAEFVLLSTLMGFFIAALLFFQSTTSVAELESILGKPRHANKPYATFEAFYPFYLGEHTDIICRRLHVVGTSLVIITSASNVGILQSLLVAGLVGNSLCNVFCSMEKGFAEFAAVILIYFVCCRFLRVKTWSMLQPLLIGYGFAWVGHFFFEHNVPATFTYPTFSLLGDFRMWYDVVTGKQYGIWDKPLELPWESKEFQDFIQRVVAANGGFQ